MSVHERCRGREWARPGSLRRSWSPTWLATRGSRAQTRRTLARLRGLRSDLIDPTIALRHGRIVKRTGDGSIIEFRSVVDAVRCAIEVQTEMAERNTPACHPDAARSSKDDSRAQWTRQQPSAIILSFLERRWAA